MQQISTTKMIKLIKLFLFFSGVFLFCFSSVAVEAKKGSIKTSDNKGLNSYSQLTISKVKYKDEILTIEGETDLPDKSVLQIKIIPDNGTAKYSVFAKTIVENSKYDCDIEIPQKPELYNGPYRIVVSFILDMQSNLNVLHSVGSGGDNLSGDLVHREPITDYKILQCSVIKPLFALQMKKYSLYSPGRFEQDSPKYVLTSFLMEWSEKDWVNMLKFSYAPWGKETKNAEKLLESWFGSIKLVGVDSLKTMVNNPLMTEFKLKLYFTKKNSKKIKEESINVKVIKDDKEKWGVFPESIINQQAIFNMNFK